MKNKYAYPATALCLLSLCLLTYYSYRPVLKTTAKPAKVVKTANPVKAHKQPLPIVGIPQKPIKQRRLPVADTGFSTQINQLKLALQVNADTGFFNTGFIQGNVSKRRLEKYLTKTDWGYVVHMPGSTPVASPAIVGDNLYACGGFGSKIYSSFQLSTGALQWSLDLSDDGPSPAVFEDSTMVFNTESCTIFALNRHNGKLMWSHWLGDPLLSTPVVSDGRVYSAYPALGLHGHEKKYKQLSPTHAMACFNARNGTILWQKWLDGDIMVTPVVDGNFLYLTTFTGSVYKIDKQNGNILACMALRATSPPSIQGNYVYVTRRADEHGKVRESIAILEANTLAFIKEINKVDAPYLDYTVQRKAQLNTDAKQWDAGNGFGAGAPASSGWQNASNNIGQSSVSTLQLFQPSTVAFHQQNIVCLMGNRIYCLNPVTGDTVWTHPFDGNMHTQGGTLATTPLVCNNYLVTVTTAGKVLALNLTNGTIAFEKDIKRKVRTAPVVYKGIIVVPTQTGDVCVVNTGIKDIDNWPVFMKNAQHKI